VRIAVDILGGDHAPREILRGVAAALRSGFSPEELLLVGPEEAIRSTLAEEGISEFPATLHTEDVVEAGESPIEALRRKPRSTVALCVGAVREGQAEGLLSFGNTGATVAAATMGLGMLPGLRRPAIAVVLNGRGGPFVLLDAGANPTPKTRHLYQYAFMGAAYARDVLGVARPRVALLNIGGEARKGSPMAKEAYQLLQESCLDFVGNLEGQDLFHGGADVLVGDGFVGNMIIKVVEGFVEFLFDGLSEGQGGGREELRAGIRRLLGAADYAESGGAILLGVQGAVFIGHGRSDARAVPPALRTVRDSLAKGVNQHITESLAAQPAGNSETGEESRA